MNESRLTNLIYKGRVRDGQAGKSRPRGRYCWHVEKGPKFKRRKPTSLYKRLMDVGEARETYKVLAVWTFEGSAYTRLCNKRTPVYTYIPTCILTGHMRHRRHRDFVWGIRRLLSARVFTRFDIDRIVPLPFISTDFAISPKLVPAFDSGRGIVSDIDPGRVIDSTIITPTQSTSISPVRALDSATRLTFDFNTPTVHGLRLYTCTKLE
ncbi:hypothetical protein EVAR_35582_1 [Eumeta japonica]|uniref:Uncharacterized protein n=1 Tax=Eumeta variegata TaxID=151549 RepID=A0A4C1XM30_EUMVA|nr:hypothetical protein EVAR_35582_1 [Eumeta japonica]